MDADKKEKSNLREIKNIIILFFVEYFKLIVILIMLTVLTVSFFTLLKPRYNKIIEKIQVISAEKSEEYERRKKYLERLREANNVYNSISREDLEKIEFMLPAKKEHEELISQIEDIVAKQNLILISLDITEYGGDDKNQPAAQPAPEKTTDKEIGKIKVNMEVSAVNYFGMKNLLSVLENNLRILDITNISFAPDQEVLVIEMLTYFKK